MFSIPRCTLNKPLQPFTRSLSNSPYGRTHVWKRRAPVLPNPVVPEFPQLVVRSDGSTFTHMTTSPRSVIRLTRDICNNPLWNSSVWAEGGAEEEITTTGRLGRFNRRFENLSGSNDWMGESPEEGSAAAEEATKLANEAARKLKGHAGRS